MRKLYFFLGLLGIALVISLFIFINNKNQTTTEQTDFPDEIGNSILPTTIEKIYKEEEKKVELTDTITTEKVADIKLLENTDQCLIDCHSIGQTTLYRDGVLFDKVDFVDAREKTKQMNDYKVYVLKDMSREERVPVFENVCEIVDINKSLTEVCSERATGEKEITREWEEYVEYKGETLQAGTYTWKIEGKKKVGENVDWVATSFGVELKEWAWWDSDWKKRIEYNLTFYDATKANVSAAINITYQAGMMNNFTDIRFANEDETAELAYWFNDGRCFDGQSCLVWVRMEGNATSASQRRVYLYFSNSLAPLKSDIKTAFMFGDDFTSAPDFSTRWYSSNEALYTSNGSVLNATGSGTSTAILMHTRGNYSNYISTVKMRRPAEADNVRLEHTKVWGSWSSDAESQKIDGDGNTYNYVSSAATTVAQAGTFWAIGKRMVIGTSDNKTLAHFLNGTIFNTKTGTTSIPKGHVGVWSYSAGKTSQWDWLHIREYVSQEPTYVSGNVVSLEDAIPIVNLIIPSDYYNTSSNQVAFNCTAEDDGLIQNVTLWINGEQNHTLNHGTSNYTSLYILLNLSDGNYAWTCTADDNTTTTQTGVIANRSFSIRKFEIDSVSYNSSSYETSSESFSMNITTNSSYNFSSPVFIYNGTSYPATITCEGTACVLSGSLIVPLNLNGVHKHNNPFYWKVNYTGDASGEGATTISNQSVEKITFALCNATLTTKYLNITFKDEGTLGRMNASITTSSWTYWLGDGSINRTYSYSTLSNFSEYDFCFSPLNRTVNTDYTLQYRLDGYPQRTYSAIRSYTNITTSLTLWLLSSLDGVYTTYITINTAEQPLEGVQVNVTRILDGAVVTISEGTTDASGSVTKFLHPDFLHTFTFVLAGYETFITSIFPSQTAYPYIIDMGGSTEDPVYDFTKGIQIQVKPERILYNDTTYNFNFTLSSDYWNVDEFGFYFYFPNRTSIGHVYSTTNGGVVTYNFNTQNYTRVEMTYYWVIDSNHTNGTAYWLIYSSGGTQYSITNFFNRLSTYLSAGIFGADEFTFSIIIFILILLFTGMMSWKFGITSPAIITIIIFVLVLFFDVGLNLIQTPVGAVEHFPTIIVGIVSAGFLVWEFSR